ncbi:hypothetical protein [Couchioplanes caeruleus]|uniref:hypothetical protein n=1 Tax=Couchioplanes caeruleus TaxID=56438 RepID=UPI000B09F5FB|nr:hypothetical protein [Couchioplanes caeruleus]
MPSITKPVTHTADVAVNNAVTRPALRPLSVANGNASNPEPTSTAAANPRTTIRAGCRTVRASGPVTNPGSRHRRTTASARQAPRPRSPHTAAGPHTPPRRPRRFRRSGQWHPQQQCDAKPDHEEHARDQQQAQQQLPPIESIST